MMTLLLDHNRERARLWVAASCRYARAEVLAKTTDEPERQHHLNTMAQALAEQQAIEAELRREKAELN